MNAEIISIGSELTVGLTVDTNAPWLSRRLAELGALVTRHATVADDLAAICDEISRASERADMLIVTGGLGPTLDDLTGQALARSMGEELILDESSWLQVKQRFHAMGREAGESNLKQAMRPASAIHLMNQWGTAPGINARLNNCDIYLLPGVPREMMAMFDHHIADKLREHSAGRVTLTRTIHTFGSAEATVGERIAHLMTRGRNPSVGTTAAGAVIGIRIVATGPSSQQAEKMLEDDTREVESILSPIVFGRESDTLQSAVAALLIKKKRTVSTAESCTGGLLAKRLTDIPGSSSFFIQGFVTYSNAAKTDLLGVDHSAINEYGAVSSQVAAAMAEGCRRKSRSEFALSTTGIAGPDGGTQDKPVGLVYHGLAAESGTNIIERRYGIHLSRAEIRDRTAKTALDMLRRALLNH
jgi:nicotinamide-nucleotide amidase